MFTPINMGEEEGRQKKKEFTENVLNKDLYPHCRNMKEKIYFMGYMTNKLLRTKFQWRKVDDRDLIKIKELT